MSQYFLKVPSFEIPSWAMNLQAWAPFHILASILFLPRTHTLPNPQTHPLPPTNSHTTIISSRGVGGHSAKAMLWPGSHQSAPARDSCGPCQWPSVRRWKVPARPRPRQELNRLPNGSGPVQDRRRKRHNRKVSQDRSRRLQGTPWQGLSCHTNAVREAERQGIAEPFFLPKI